MTGHDILDRERWSADPIAVSNAYGYISTRTEFAEHGPDAHRVTSAWAHENSGGVRRNGLRQVWLRARAGHACTLAAWAAMAGGPRLLLDREARPIDADAASEYWRLAYQRCPA